MRRHLRTNRRVYYALSPSQHQVINQIANSLTPGEVRHSFLLRVSAQLRLAGPVGGCPDELVERVIDKVLGDVAA